MARTGKFFVLLEASSSRAIAAISKTGNARSSAAASAGCINAEKYMAALPATQNRNSTSKGVPEIGNRPVQLGTAVSRKPAITALV